MWVAQEESVLCPMSARLAKAVVWPMTARHPEPPLQHRSDDDDQLRRRAGSKWRPRGSPHRLVSDKIQVWPLVHFYVGTGTSLYKGFSEQAGS